MKKIVDPSDYPTIEARDRIWKSVSSRMPSRRKVGLRTLSLSVVIIAGAGLAVPAMAGAVDHEATVVNPPGVTPEIRAQMEHQWFAGSVIFELNDLGEGYVDGGIDPDRDAAWATWKGKLSDKAKQIIADGEARGVTTRIIYVDYTPEQVVKWGVEVSHELQDAGFDIWDVEPVELASAVQISGSDLELADQAMVTEIAERLKVPVPVLVGEFDENSRPITF